jgi:hypothetical protein
MERWKSTILATQVMALLTPEAQNLIKIHTKKHFNGLTPSQMKLSLIAILFSMKFSSLCGWM